MRVAVKEKNCVCLFFLYTNYHCHHLFSLSPAAVKKKGIPFCSFSFIHFLSLFFITVYFLLIVVCLCYCGRLLEIGWIGAFEWWHRYQCHHSAAILPLWVCACAWNGGIDSRGVRSDSAHCRRCSSYSCLPESCWRCAAWSVVSLDYPTRLP